MRQYPSSSYCIKKEKGIGKDEADRDACSCSWTKRARPASRGGHLGQLFWPLHAWLTCETRNLLHSTSRARAAGKGPTPAGTASRQCRIADAWARVLRAFPFRVHGYYVDTNSGVCMLDTNSAHAGHCPHHRRRTKLASSSCVVQKQGERGWYIWNEDI